jgi:tetratricopeptide (TPR) repeat protein
MVLRLAKRWGGVGFSASHLARRCDLTVSRVQDYVSGRTEARQVEVFERVADGLHIPGAMFNLAPRPWETVIPARSVLGNDPRPAPGRESNSGAKSLVATLVPTEFLWTPERAGTDYLEAARASIDLLVSLDNRFGAADLSRVSEQIYGAVHQKLGKGDYEPSIRKDLLAAAGELAEVAGWLAYDANRQELVRRMNNESLYFTRLSGDKSMELLTLQNASMHAGFMNRPQEAHDLADLVLSGAYQLTPRLKALFLTRKARALAQGGDESALRLFNEVRSLYLEGISDSDPGWAWWIDERELAWHEAMCRKDLGDSRRAIAQFERSVAATPAAETRSQYLHRAYLLGAQVSVRSWSAVETTLTQLGPMAREVASIRTAVLLRGTLAEIRNPDKCAPRQLLELGQNIERQLAATTV